MCAIKFPSQRTDSNKGFYPLIARFRTAGFVATYGTPYSDDKIQSNLIQRNHTSFQDCYTNRNAL